jgi:hypothetical protein
MTESFGGPERDRHSDHLVETPESLRDDDPEAMPLDRGREPGEGPAAADSFGTTAAEEAAGEDLDHRLAQEEPDAGAATDGGGDGNVSAEEAAMNVEPE